MSNARNRIGESIDRVNNAAGRIGAIADDLYGVEPPSGQSVERPTRCGEFGMLHDGIDYLAEALERLENQIGRLNGLQPQNQAGSIGGPAITRR